MSDKKHQVYVSGLIFPSARLEMVREKSIIPIFFEAFNIGTSTAALIEFLKLLFLGFLKPKCLISQ